MTRARLWGLRVAVVVVVLGALGVSLRFVPFFDVRQIEVIGARYLDPAVVLEALAVEPDRSIFASLGGLEARAAALPGVARADLQRRLPGTLRVRVVENAPVALVVADSGLIPLGAAGDTLPFDPLVSGLSLPVLAAPDTGVLRMLALVRVMDGALYDLVDAAGPLDGAVELVSGRRRVVLHPGFGTEDFVALQAVRRDLVGRTETFRLIDTRFDGWLVVRREDA